MKELIKILHLEDSLIDAEFVQRELTRAEMKYEIKVVGNKADYIKALKTFSPDIILADHSLPSFNSEDALALKKELGIDIPFILITATVSEEYAVSIMLNGADDYILKDRLQRLPTAVLNIIEKYRREKERLELQAVSLKKIEESEKRYREIVETAQEGIWMTDENNLTVFVNKKLTEILGYSSEEILGKSILYFMDEETKKTAELIMNRQKYSTKKMYECRFICKSGNVIWTSLANNFLLDDEGKFKGMLCMVTDITERKNSEEELTQLNNALKKSADELVASNRELEKFAYAASHDLQEPLRMVSGFLQLLQDKYGNELDDTAQKYINFAVDGASRMKTLIFDLLEFSRVSTVKKENTLIDLNELVNKTLLNLRAAVEESKAVVTVQKLPKVFANEFHLIQLFQNLIGNAIKYRGSESPLIEIGFAEKDSMREFFVRDNGIGIDPVNYERVFVIFQRLHNRTEYAGTGIGLAVCRKIVELHGGKIWVESSKGKGSTFYFTLPKSLQAIGKNTIHQNKNIVTRP
jgi:PAS domain S-box-containing protein